MHLSARKPVAFKELWETRILWQHSIQLTSTHFELVPKMPAIQPPNAACLPIGERMWSVLCCISSYHVKGGWQDMTYSTARVLRQGKKQQTLVLIGAKAAAITVRISGPETSGWCPKTWLTITIYLSKITVPHGPTEAQWWIPSTPESCSGKSD